MSGGQGPDGSAIHLYHFDSIFGLSEGAHRDVLAVRGLAQRGKLSTNDSALNFLARLGDNGVVWHVLSFWRAAD